MRRARLAGSGAARLPRLRFLSGLGGGRAQALAGLLEPFTAQNAINPSFLDAQGRTFMAFRHLDRGGRQPFRAAMIARDHARGVVEGPVDLSARAAEFGVPVVADPKLVLLGDSVWVTFNDGTPRTRNRLFLMRVAPDPGPPLECDYLRRRVTEKNWTFFTADGMLKAIYSLQPFHVLQTPWDALSRRTPGVLVFGDDPAVPAPIVSTGPVLTIGPQAVWVEGELCTVAHEKWVVAGRRTYVGRWARVTLSGSRMGARFSPVRLAHSPQALIGQPRKFNRNLW